MINFIIQENLGVLHLNSKKQLIVDVIARVLADKISFHQALQILNVSESTLRRYIKNFLDSGSSFVIHKNSNKKPWNRMPADKEQKIIQLCKDKYYDYNRTHAREEIESNEGLIIPKETFNRICTRNNILTKNIKVKRKKSRARRERMSQIGNMIQLDGSPHLWFGHKKSCLVIAIDDATSDILYGEFSPTETTFACMNVIKKVFINNGVFQILYVDRAGMFGRNEVNCFGSLKRTGFSSLKFCLEKFGVNIIFAQSAEAKGRVERAFKTLQDRLLPELRSRGVRTISEANNYFNNVYLPKHRANFAVEAFKKESGFTKLLPSVDLNEKFYMIEKRVIKNDHTFSLNKKILDIDFKEENFSGKEVEIRTFPNGRVSYYVDEKEVWLKNQVRIKFIS